MKGEKKEVERAACEKHSEGKERAKNGKEFPPAPREREAFTSFSP